jgi:hypothetical protein
VTAETRPSVPVRRLVLESCTKVTGDPSACANIEQERIPDFERDHHAHSNSLYNCHCDSSWRCRLLPSSAGSG